VNTNETITLSKSFVVVGVFSIISQLSLNFTKTLTNNIISKQSISH